MLNRKMKYLTTGLLLLLAFTVHSEEMPIVKMQTNLGVIILELNLEKAPKSVANFLRYAREGFYIMKKSCLFMLRFLMKAIMT